jgi:hypothetical protein
MRPFALSTIAAVTTVAVLVAHGAALARPKATGAGEAFVVTSVSPARNQEVLPDLSDPGVGNTVVVRFSTAPYRPDLLDESNVVNNLSPKVRFLDWTSAQVASLPTVRRNVLQIEPLFAGRPTLPAGRYALTLRSSIRSSGGHHLNGGARDFATQFFVGTGPFPLIVQRVTPTAGQERVGARRPIVLAFDEPVVDADVARESIRIEDRSTDPPTPILAKVSLVRGGLGVALRPDGRLPPDAFVAVIVQGRGSAPPARPVLRGRDGGEFVRESGPLWSADETVPTLFHSRNGDFDDVSGEFSFTFRTRAAAR